MKRKNIFWVVCISCVFFIVLYVLAGSNYRDDLSSFISSLNDFIIPILTLLNIYVVYGIQNALGRNDDILKKHKRRIIYQNKKHRDNNLKIKLNPNATIEESYSNLSKSISGLLNLCENLAESDNEVGEDLDKILLKCDIDPSVLNKIPYYENPFVHRNFLTHCIGIPNFTQRIDLNMLELQVNMYRLLLSQTPDNKDYRQKLKKACTALEEYQDKFTLCD